MPELLDNEIDDAFKSADRNHNGQIEKEEVQVRC